MAKPTTLLSWCIVRLGEDMNWWVNETSDPVHWDTDALSVIDPRQIAHLLDLCEPLRECGLDLDLFDNAFYTFRIDKEVTNGMIRLVRFRDSILGTEEKLFGLPDVLDEEKGPYAELVDQLIKSRVKFLNDTIEFEQPLTIDELEEALNDRASADYGEGRAMHVFNELLSILEYVPEGYEDEIEEEAPRKATKSPIDEIPDIVEEDMEADETMKWGDEEKDKDGEEGDEDDDDEDGDADLDDDIDEDEDEAPARPAKKPAAKPAPKKPAPKKKK